MSIPLLLAEMAIFVLISAFFVCSEYALVSVRRSKIESEAKKGHRKAKRILAALDHRAEYVAGIQIAITLIGIGIGSVLEPQVYELLAPVFGTHIPLWLGQIISVLLVSYPLVVLGELVPKYITLRSADTVAKGIISPLRFIIWFLTPFVWIFDRSSRLVLTLMRVPVERENPAMSRDELSILVQASGEDGTIDESHSDVVTRTLRLDQLDAADVMTHRMDIKWIDIDTPCHEILKCLGEIPHSRVPVCRGDVDDLVGIVYVHDAVKHYDQPDFTIEKLMRAAVFVPENLGLDKVVKRMQEDKTQVLIIRDEYGGTSGLVTLEDVIEEVFGDLEDKLESERPALEKTSSRRISARADVRMDELLSFLDIEETVPDTRTLAQVLVDKLERTTKLGDTVSIGFATLRVEQIVRQRVIRVGIYLEDPKPVEE